MRGGRWREQNVTATGSGAAVEPEAAADELFDGEVQNGPLAARPRKARTEGGLVEEKAGLAGQVGLVAGGEEDAGLAVGDDVRQLRQAGGDDGPPGGQRLQGDVDAAATGRHPDE